ncbi:MULTISPECIES: S1 family peptidase [unclassified Streptosporangium]|uniref:S1 family peptidase n=1 Tax=unclassified Streptosporangium TaxID=2632669 RepID=UPI002E28594C|nr:MULTISPECIES: S1 family peptidase [unclassified Streptosporangium]
MPRRHAAITGCVLAIAALTVTAVPAVARPLTAGAEVVVKPPPGMLAALQRDLHLTAEQAQARLLNEVRLAPVAAQLREELGEDFGGSWLTGDLAQTLVVATTDKDHTPQIVAGGARAEVVTRSLEQLNTALDKVDTALSDHLGGPVRYVDVRSNKVVVLSNVPSTTQNVIQASDVDPVTVRVVSSIEQPQLLSDLVGGNAYYIGTSERCSIGFSVTKGTQNGFVSAGHCGTQGNTTSGFNHVDQGVFQASTFPDSDRSWIAVNSDWTPKPWVGNGAGGTVNVSGSRVAIEGASVCRSGSTTGWHCGTIQQLNTSITYPQGNVAELTRTNVCAEPGDSGGSFISIDQAQGVTSGGSGDCTSGGVTYFQPVGEILTTYGLTLTTTSGSTPPPPPPPTTPGTCTGYSRTVTGTLTNGQSVYQPNNRYYQSTAGGLHSACLDGADGTDFDLYLQKWDSRKWISVATAESPTPDEKITYTGTAGYYRYRVVSFSGSGAYTLGYSAP